jgi:dTDP-4-dehydrorhamnose reductase
MTRDMARVLVTGSTGLLGGSVVPRLRARGLDVVAHGLRGAADVRADLRSAGEAERAVASAAPDVVLNLAALADVDACERDPDRAYECNVRSVENLAAALRGRSSVAFVHVSTDHVYDGAGPHPESARCLRNVYALSKYWGERVALEAGATVLRTSFFGASRRAGRPSWSDWLIDAFEQKRPVTLFTDVQFSPLSMDTLADLLAAVLAAPRPGVFNLGSRGGMSKRDFAHALARHLGLSADAACDGSVKQAGLRAARPADMRMDCALFERTFGAELPTLRGEIQRLRRSP